MLGSANLLDIILVKFPEVETIACVAAHYPEKDGSNTCMWIFRISLIAIDEYLLHIIRSELKIYLQTSLVSDNG